MKDISQRHIVGRRDDLVQLGCLVCMCAVAIVRCGGSISGSGSAISGSVVCIDVVIVVCCCLYDGISIAFQSSFDLFRLPNASVSWFGFSVGAVSAVSSCSAGNGSFLDTCASANVCHACDTSDAGGMQS